MLELNKFSEKIFNPIVFNHSIFDLKQSLRIGIKLKYIILYFFGFLFLFSIFRIITFSIFDINSYLYTFISYIYILLCIITFHIIDTLTAKIAFEEIKGNFTYKLIDAFLFVRRNIFSILLPTILLIIILSVFLLLIISLSLLSKILIIGPVILSCFYILLFILGLICIFTLLALIITILYGPIIFSLFGGDSFSTIFESYSLAWSNFFYILFYSFINFILSFLFSFLTGIIFYFNIYLINYFLSSKFILDYKYTLIWNRIESIIFYNNYSTLNLNIFEITASYIILLSVFTLVFSILSIFFSILNIGKMITFINIKKKSSNYDIIINNI